MCVYVHICTYVYVCKAGGSGGERGEAALSGGRKGQACEDEGARGRSHGATGVRAEETGACRALAQGRCLAATHSLWLSPCFQWHWHWPWCDCGRVGQRECQWRRGAQFRLLHHSPIHHQELQKYTHTCICMHSQRAFLFSLIAHSIHLSPLFSS